MGNPSRVIAFTDLASADLVVDALYNGGTAGTIADEPIAKLLPVGNQGGFRYAGSPKAGTVRLVVLYTTTTEVDWPDALDAETGIFTYFGDNRHPGSDLHHTQRGGNLILRDAFAKAHQTKAERLTVPPFLLFEKAAPGRRVMFRGLLAPGAADLTSDDDLVAIWRSVKGERFQNYRARFTVLDVPTVPRAWLTGILDNHTNNSPHVPPSWTAWVTGRRYRPLLAPKTSTIRSKAEQLPTDPAGRAILTEIRNHFRGHEHDFEPCAVQLWRLIAPSTARCDTTRPTMDGGRDAIGDYALGPPADRITIDFALEAKCYAETTAVGTRDLARLISRIRHREFGVFITTSYFHHQAYSEVRADRHPIALICGRDIVDALRSHGYTDLPAVKAWLKSL